METAVESLNYFISCIFEYLKKEEREIFYYLLIFASPLPLIPKCTEIWQGEGGGGGVLDDKWEGNGPNITFPPIMWNFTEKDRGKGLGITLVPKGFIITFS